MGEKQRRRLYWILTYLIALVGVGVLLYPLLSDVWNRWRDSSLVVQYRKTVASIPDTTYEQIWKDAQAYNAAHPVNVITDVFSFSEESEDHKTYLTLLDPNGNGLMGVLEIPKIGQELPIYHGLSAEVLEQGVGHLEGTSLPIGGDSTHTALAAHRGLPGKKLFTDLDQMEPGDQFYLHVLSETLAYQVTDVLTVLPENTETLTIEPGKDYCTLVTCTPYGINTHRLLVRGERVPYSEQEQKQQASERNVVREIRNLPLKLVCVGLIIIIIFVPIIRWVLDRKKKQQENPSENRPPKGTTKKAGENDEKQEE